MISSLTAVGALVFTSLSLQSTRQQIEITERGQVTERFYKAVEQIANTDNVEIRLGGIYALGRIARDSARDNDEVSRLLATFIRRKRAIPAQPGPDTCAVDLGRDDVDVTAALKFVSSKENGLAPDLSLTCLTGADLDEAHLHCAMLDGAYLPLPTSLVGVDLSRASLSGARFYVPTKGGVPAGVSLTKANLSHAQLTFADLSHAYLGATKLSGADLSSAILVDAKLDNADLRGANLFGANLTGANFAGADLTGAYIKGAKFTDSAARDAALARGATEADPTQVGDPGGCDELR